MSTTGPGLPDPSEPPYLPDQTSDDTDLGWGERPSADRDDDADDVERFLAERPPHHDTP